VTVDIVEVTAESPDNVNGLAVLFDDYRAHYGQPRDLPATRTWLDGQLAQRRLMAFAAVERGQVHGFLSICPLPASLRLGLAWSIRDVFVAPQHRRRGVASTLLQHAIVNARRAGAQRVSLQTEAGNAAALSLYRTAGFQLVEGLEVLSLDLTGGEQ
jgi:GNAT superfamily N-acetyltransferase